MRIVRSGALLGLVVGSLALSACAGDPAPSASENPTEAAATGDIRLWLNGGDTPQELRDYLIETFEDQNPGSTLTIEEQDWNGLVPRLQTALASEQQTPDVVEIGNTQSPLFSTAGAFSELTDIYNELGGDKLLEGFVEAGSVDGKVYAVPYYSGARAVFYRKDLLEKAGVELPTTLAEFGSAAAELQKANPDDVENFSGFWFPGQDWYNGIAWIYTHGGELATQEGDLWVGGLSSAESRAALEEVQEIFENGTNAPVDADSNEPWVPFNNGEVAMFSAPTWARWSIDLPECNEGVDPEDTSDEATALRGKQQACNESKTGVFALPGAAAGEPATVFAGGSNIAIPAKSQNQELAKNLLDIIFAEEYQGMLATNGLIPGNTDYADLLGDDVYAQAAREAALGAKLTPPAAKWADVEGERVMEDFFQQIAAGADIATASRDADARLEEILN